MIVNYQNLLTEKDNKFISFYDWFRMKDIFIYFALMILNCLVFGFYEICFYPMLDNMIWAIFLGISFTFIIIGFVRCLINPDTLYYKIVRRNKYPIIVDLIRLIKHRRGDFIYIEYRVNNHKSKTPVGIFIRISQTECVYATTLSLSKNHQVLPADFLKGIISNDGFTLKDTNTIDLYIGETPKDVQEGEVLAIQEITSAPIVVIDDVKYPTMAQLTANNEENI